LWALMKSMAYNGISCVCTDNQSPQRAHIKRLSGYLSPLGVRI
jgi:hypothetical protein